MSGYTFSNLSPADFEDLARDLIGAELGVRFEAFGPGPDGGMDGRHAKAGRTTILQAKHYAGSTFRALQGAMAEVPQALKSLRKSRYLLATSRPLTPQNKAELVKTLSPLAFRSG